MKANAPVQSTITPATLDAICCDALQHEANAWPKPGLVTPVDSGSHRDMNYASFVNSIAALRGYFADIAQAGLQAATYPELQKIALAAESRMLAATHGANTHRGAIFNLGLLAAASAYQSTRPERVAWIVFGRFPRRTVVRRKHTRERDDGCGCE